MATRSFLKQKAGELRANQTDAERHLWHCLRRDQLGVRFYRQRVLGPYIVDFYAPGGRLVVEVDGGQHFLPEGVATDAIRDRWLKARGLMVLRFDSRSVLRETNAVVSAIHRAVRRRLDARHFD